MLEKRIIGTDDSLPALTRYVYANHLQSASLELDEGANIISYEEYHPYGTTAFQAKSATINAVAKRYRYTGKERDEESGLYYHGARYYIPWLAKWTASDPLESKYAGMSPYNYSFNNPVMWNDLNGADPDEENPDGGNAGGATPSGGKKRFLSYKELGEDAPKNIKEGIRFLNHGTSPEGGAGPSLEYAKMISEDFGFNNNLLVFSLEDNTKMGKRLEEKMKAKNLEYKPNETLLASMTSVVVKVDGRWRDISEQFEVSQISDMKVQVIINSDIHDPNLATASLVHELTLHASHAAKIIKEANGDWNSVFNQLKNPSILEKEQHNDILIESSRFNAINRDILKLWNDFQDTLGMNTARVKDSKEYRDAAIKDGYVSYAAPLATAYNSYLDILANMQSVYSKGGEFKDRQVVNRSKNSLIVSIESGYFNYTKHVRIMPVN